MAFLAIYPLALFAMTSTNYIIEWDSLNSGGTDDSSSTNYLMEDTIGEHATGLSESESYDLTAGYRIADGDTPASITFSIRNGADTANTNVCQLGTLSLTQVSYCSYRLRITTNAITGFTATIQPDDVFSNGSVPMEAIENDMPFVAGVEAYGIAQLSGASSGGRTGGGDYTNPVDEASAAQDATLTFDVDSTPLSFTSATTILSYTAPFHASVAPSLDTTSLVMHGASVGAGTLTGNYAHTVTYRVTGSF